MTTLSLMLTMQAERPAASALRGDRLTFQVWRGGPCVGGTLDQALRGRNEGPASWCALADARSSAGEDSAPVRILEQINPGDALSPDGAGALFIVMMDVAPDAEAEFNDWYDLEHIPCLRQVPGVLAARRFRARNSTPRYAAIYHLADASTYASSPWREADQTPWIGRMRRFQRDRRYFMFTPA